MTARPYVIAFTGHRPSKVSKVKAAILAFIQEQLAFLGPDLHALCGMALGVDQWAVAECLRANVPFTAVVPFQDHGTGWNTSQWQHYQHLLEQAHHVVCTSAAPYHPRLYQVRNAWMVDRCRYLIAIWDGSRGGTANCVHYAFKRKRELEQLGRGLELDGMRFDPQTGRATPLFEEARMGVAHG